MREVTVPFVKRFTNNDPTALRDATGLLTKLTGVWRSSAGNPLADRYAYLHAAVDAELASILSKLPAPVACARGCNHCCKFNQILISKHEAALLIRHIEGLESQAKAAVIARILASTSQSGGGNSSPCALLDASGCSVYASRPLPCRGYYSISESACRSRLMDDAPSPPTVASARVVELAALEVSKAGKHPPFELNSLLRRIYSDPAKVALWADGQCTEETDLAVSAAGMK
jgi:Fe-S-cluster containining protein